MENIILGLEGKLNIKEAAKKIENICNKYGFEVEVFGENQIEELKLAKPNF